MNKGRDYQKSVIWIPLDNYPPLFRKNNNMNHIPHNHELILTKLQVKQKKEEEQDVNLDAIVVGKKSGDNEIEMKQITVDKSVVQEDTMVVVDEDNLKKKEEDDDKKKEEELSLVYNLLTYIYIYIYAHMFLICS
jgi:NAD(P)H-hydrate repair Nnr-like enzyme with NAD(P)H-hydrate dehydratase domain